MFRIGFDNEKYLAEQSEAILERVSKFGTRLYLEFGGKLLYDYHASRVLPGFDPNVKMRLLQKLKDQADIILCIYAGDIERKKVRADFGITYDTDTFKQIDDLRSWGLDVTGVVITRFDDQPAAVAFKNKLERRGIRTYTHRAIKGYPTDIDRIVSDEGYGANPHVEVTKPLVVVTAPGPNSGKMATCLSQVYHDNKQGVDAGYAKFETFPIWSIPCNHPVNVAYEAATADLRDVNMIDPFHMAAYNEQAVNYNRDVETYPVLRAILERITESAAMYKSPTDMGVNRAGFAITDDAVVQEAAKQEIIRRRFRYACEYAMGMADKESVERVDVLMKEFGLTCKDRVVVAAARQAAEEAQNKPDKGNKGVYCGAAIHLPDGEIVTSCNSPLMHVASSLVLNAVKHLAGLPDQIHLLSENIVESIASMKKDILNSKSVSLDLEETLIALSISSTTNPTAEAAMKTLKQLNRCEMHITHMPSAGDETGLRRLGVNLTSDPEFASKHLYVD